MLGVGTVGGGTATVLKRNAAEISRRAGRDIVRKMAANLDLTPPAPSSATVDVVADGFAVARHPDIDIVVELIGENGIAKELVLAAIDSQQHGHRQQNCWPNTVTKSLPAPRKKGRPWRFEAAVAGGIPIIKALREGPSANHIEWIAGIINGTSNFILTEMRRQGSAFADVLAEANAWATPKPT